MGMNDINLNNTKSFDYIGISLSIICGVHCLVTPLLIIYLPIIGNTIESIWFHTGTIIFMIFTFYQSIYKHFKQHKSKLTLGLGITGLILFLSSYLNELTHHSEEHEHGDGLMNVHGDETYMIYIAIVGAILLISAHFLNIRKCRCLRGRGICSEKD
jgi:hypothetical protein